MTIKKKMPIRSQENVIGAWAFLIGVVLAVAIGLVSSAVIPVPNFGAYSPTLYAILVILGVLIGFFGVTGKDSQTFLLAGTVIVIVSNFGKEGIYGSLIGVGLGLIVPSIFGALLALFVPATIIVALKTVFSISKI